MTRAERRHRRQRKVAYAKRKLRKWGTMWENRASLWADNMAKCSCPMCKVENRHKRPELVIDGDIRNWMEWYNA